MRIAINGFGRIGRNFLRTIYANAQAHKKITVAAINIGPANPDFIAHMFTYDTIMGKFAGNVRLENGYLFINDDKIKVIAQSDITKIDWGALDIDWVVESSGHFTKRAGAQLHLDSGAKNVLITAPATGEDIAIIPGVNDDAFDPAIHHIVSLGSCTTNALLPMLKVMHDSFGVAYAYMTTIHAYTNTQVLLDVECGDLRRSRAAALNIIPTTTGATKMVGKILPEIASRIDGHAVRVPVAVVSLVDLSITTEKEVTAKDVNEAFAKACSSMAGIVGITHEPLVSSDFVGMNESVVIDGQLTRAHEHHAKLFGWYDNEWGYSMRLRDFLMHL